MSDIPNPSLLLELENAVLAIESAGFTEEAIFAFVNMILKGFITNGTWTPEYLEYATQILQQRQQPQARTVLTDASGNPLLK